MKYVATVTFSKTLLKGFALAGVLTLGACALGPDYERPTMDLGEAYKELESGKQGEQIVGASTAEVQGWVPAQPGDAALRGDWWQLFNDPILSQLMLTLQDANLSIIQAEAQYRQAQALLQSARSGFFPTVGASAAGARSGSGRSASTISGVGGDNPSNQFSLSGDVSWEPDLWGRVRRSVEASGAGLQASRADVATTRLSMQSTLAQTYFQLRVMDAERRLLQQTVKAYERSLTVTQNRYNAGIAAQVDIESSRTQLENGRTQLLALDWQRAQLEHAIAVLLGQTPASFSLAPSELVARAPVVPVGLPSQLVQRRPDVAAAERRTAEANARIGVAQAAWFPSLTLSAQGGYRASEWAQWLSAPASFWSLGPALALTIFDGGAREAQLQESRAAYDAQAASYRQTVLTALREVEDYLVQLHVLGQEQITQGRALASARESLRLTRNQYEAGLIDYLSVVQVETTALSTERSALSLVSDRLLTSVQLIAALGGGWDASQLDQADESQEAQASTASGS
ncbi:efflux transporter outer membrane subunit [Pusillimonas sp. T7-7]|uniref:efflux transporter outer membrane subunit n=1 Tax=Pusillimonas sp. (strain T7-7) TaxID=1007105 RepID=UPI00067457EF|nr:efflux transporter outer membrane subunit [Pusillimonas sp. T7-7]